MKNKKGDFATVEFFLDLPEKTKAAPPTKEIGDLVFALISMVKEINPQCTGCVLDVTYRGNS